MNQKRSRSINWDEEEKQLFMKVMKDYTHIIESKSLTTKTNKLKSKAWEDVLKKFNELNCRKRDLIQIKIKWKTMKMHARKRQKRVGGTRPPTLNSQTQIKDLLTTENKDSDVIVVDNTEDSQDSKTDAQGSTSTILYYKSGASTPQKSTAYMDNEITEQQSATVHDHDYYVTSITQLSKQLKEAQHKRCMEMAEEEHAIKMEIVREKLKCAILEREILELKKHREENLL